MDSEPLLGNITKMKENHSDPMQKDRKKLPLSEPISTFCLFLVYLFFILPIWLSIILPFSIITVFIEWVWNYLNVSATKQSRKDDQQQQANNNYGSMNQNQPIVIDSHVIPHNEREFDLILFGATGFTGKLAAIYLTKTYGSKKFRWAIAGRRKDALQQVLSNIQSIDETMKNIPIILADSADLTSLVNMVKRTKVVITTAGPFDKYGTNLVHACAVTGTHYSDITGETDWVRKMIDLYDDVAKQSGAKIVNFAGHDCIPWDLLALVCFEKLNKDPLGQKLGGQKLCKIHFYDEVNAQASGGTLATVFHSLRNRVIYKSQLGYDPLLKQNASLLSSSSSSSSLSSTAVASTEVTNPFSNNTSATNTSAATIDNASLKSTNKFLVKNAKFLSYAKEAKSWIGPFVMAPVMANCVRRSNALLNFNNSPTSLQSSSSSLSSPVPLEYAESEVYASFFAGFISICNLLILASVIVSAPLAELAKMTVLPKPGQGPSEKTMEAGFLKITAYATGDKGGKVKAVIYFPHDPGYRDTARMLVEAGLVLALQDDEVSKKVKGGGILTPAACQGTLLLDRLIATGTYFHIE